MLGSRATRWLVNSCYVVIVIGLLLGAVPEAGAAGELSVSRGRTGAEATVQERLRSDPRFFPETNFSIRDDRFWDYFHKRGGVRTFGYPVSRPFIFHGTLVQFFQRHVMQLQPDGRVGLLNLFDDGLLPYTRFNGSTVPEADPSIIAEAPRPGTPDYLRFLPEFLRRYVPDTWDGMPVKFFDRFMNTVSFRDVFPDGRGDDGLMTGFNLEMWGFPTSAPAADPNNGNFVYQRFQRGIMHYDATKGVTEGLLLADYLKAIIIGAPLPRDLEEQARTSPVYRTLRGQYNPRTGAGPLRPDELPATDMTDAFEPELPRVGPPAPAAPPPMIAEPVTIIGFNSQADVAAFEAQATGSRVRLSWNREPRYVREGSGSLKVEFERAAARDATISLVRLPKELPWGSFASIAVDIYVPADWAGGRLRLALQVDSAAPTFLPSEFVTVEPRGQWQRVAWALQPREAATATRLGIVVRAEQDAPGVIYLDHIRGVPPVIRVDAAQIVRQFDPVALYGSNLAYYYDPRFFESTRVRELAKAIGAYSYRIPGGLNADVYHWNGNGVRDAQGRIIPSARNPDGTWKFDFGDWKPGFEVFGEAETGHPLPSWTPDFSRVNDYRLTPKVDVNMMADWVRSLDPRARLIVTTNVGTGSRLRATGPGGTLREEDVAAGAREAAAWVRYFNIRRGLGVKYWEVGNEYLPWAAEIGGHVQDNSPQGWRWMTATDYATIFRAYAKAMKAVDPSIQVAGPVSYLNAPADATGQGNWIEAFLAGAGDYVDVLDIHFYEMGDNLMEYMAASQLISQQVSRIRAMLKPYEAKRGRPIPIAISEWSDYLDQFPVGSALFVADALGEIIASGVEWANMWDLGGQEHGIIRDFGRGYEPTGRYWAQYLWARHMGTTLVSSSLGELSRARLAVHATRLADGSLAIMVINKDPEVDMAVPVQIANFTPQGQAEVYTWGEQQYRWDRAAGRPVLNTGPAGGRADVGQSFTYTFPRSSITVFKLRPAAQPAGLILMEPEKR